MDIGAMRERVTIQSALEETNEIGEPVQGWTDVATVWATVRDMSGREYLAAQMTQNAAQTKITIRHRLGIVPAMRVVRGAQIYNIHAVLNASGKRDYLVLMCTRLD